MDSGSRVAALGRTKCVLGSRQAPCRIRTRATPRTMHTALSRFSGAEKLRNRDADVRTKQLTPVPRSTDMALMDKNMRLASPSALAASFHAPLFDSPSTYTLLLPLRPSVILSFFVITFYNNTYARLGPARTVSHLDCLSQLPKQFSIR